MESGDKNWKSVKNMAEKPWKSVRNALNLPWKSVKSMAKNAMEKCKYDRHNT